jgi:hypothetical protein
MSQYILPFLPGYMFDGNTVRSTGVAIPPSQHINPANGDIVYYLRPVFEYGVNVGMFIRHQGIIDWIESNKHL